MYIYQSSFQPKASVIVAVYNSEQWLRRCVDSLLAQTFSDFELLLLDDGSTDDSGRICDEYAAKDSRVRVMHNANQGVAATRQMGIDNAKGEYVIFCDADDWVEPNMLADMVAVAEKEDDDIVIADYWWETEKKKIYKDETVGNGDHWKVLEAVLNYNITGASWNKLVKRGCYEKYDLQFPKMNITEDTYVVSKLLLNDVRIGYTRKAYYHYMTSDNPGSLLKTVKQYRERLEAFYGLLHDKYRHFWLVYLGYRWNWLSYDILAGGRLTPTEFKHYFHDMPDVPRNVLFRDMNWRAKLNTKFVLLATRHYWFGRVMAKVSTELTHLLR